MDLDFNTVFSIVELIGGIKETYKSFKNKNNSTRNNRFQFQQPNRFPPPKNKRTTPRRGFWI